MKFFLIIFLILNLFFSQNIFAENVEVFNISDAEKNIEQGILPFGDLNISHPAKDAILELYRRNIVTGYEDQTFRPDSKISRAEFVKIVLGATNCTDCTRPTEETKIKFTEIPFDDIRLWDWFYYCISIGKEQKIITGYLSDGLFRPHKNIARGEAVAILLRKVGVEISEYNGEFHDVKEEYWFKDYVKTAVEVGLISAKNGYVNPLEEITRGEFAMITSNLLSISDCRENDLDENGIRDFLEEKDGIGEGKWGDSLSDKEEEFLNNIDLLNNILKNKLNLTNNEKEDILNNLDNINNIKSILDNNLNLTNNEKEDILNNILNNNPNLNNKEDILMKKAKDDGLNGFIDNILEKIKCIFIEDVGDFEYQGVIKNSEGKIFSVTEEKF